MLEVPIRIILASVVVGPDTNASVELQGGVAMVADPGPSDLPDV